MRKTLVCQFSKTTPNAIQYQQVDARGEPIKRDSDGLVVGNVYLRKAAIAGKIPHRITVSIEYQPQS
jgi:hypothetical protein